MACSPVDWKNFIVTNAIELQQQTVPAVVFIFAVQKHVVYQVLVGHQQGAEVLLLPRHAGEV